MIIHSRILYYGWWFLRVFLSSAWVFFVKIATPNSRCYNTRSTSKRQMEQIQADVVAMGVKMDTRVDQLMEIIQNMARQ